MSEKGRVCGKVGCRVEKSPDRPFSQPTAANFSSPFSTAISREGLKKWGGRHGLKELEQSRLKYETHYVVVVPFEQEMGSISIDLHSYLLICKSLRSGIESLEHLPTACKTLFV